MCVLVQMPSLGSLDPGCLGMGGTLGHRRIHLGEWGWEHVEDACRCCTDKATVPFLHNLCVFRGALGMLTGQEEDGCGTGCSVVPRSNLGQRSPPTITHPYNVPDLGQG